MRILSQSLLIFISLLFFAHAPVQAATYYVSPSGNDAGQGSNSSPWATFKKSFGVILPGDTLILKDGVYKQGLYPNKNGTASAPITIKAENDGKAIIDGEHVREPVRLGYYLNDATSGNYFILEGLVAINGGEDGGDSMLGSVYHIWASNNILRRVSGYNAWVDGNSYIFNIVGGDNNTLEDCIAAGTGRKMIILYQTEGSVVRRCFADWHRWDGNARQEAWPWGENIDIYNSSNNLVENSIGYGGVPRYSFTIRANGSKVPASNNRILGSIATYAGLNASTLTPIKWDGNAPPGKNTVEADKDGYRVGFMIFGVSDATLNGNVLQDVLSVNNAGFGFALSDGIYNANPTNTTIRRARFDNNNLGAALVSSSIPKGTSALKNHISEITTVDQTYIRSLWDGTSLTIRDGSGPQLENRYVNGQVTSQPLWPWPMDSRIQAEYQRYFGKSNFTVTNEIYHKILKGSPITPQPTLPAGVSPTPRPTTITGNPADYDTDGDVDVIDYLKLTKSFLLDDCDLNLTGAPGWCSISIFDINSLLYQRLFR